MSTDSYNGPERLRPAHLDRSGFSLACSVFDEIYTISFDCVEC